MKIILFSLTLMFLFVGMIGSVNADGVPEWVKNTAGWWATDAISENEFVNAIEFLVNEGIIVTDDKNSVKQKIFKTRNQIITSLWNDGKLPSKMSDIVEKNIEEKIFSKMPNVKQVDRYTVIMEHNVQSKMYLLHPEIKINNELIIINNGHGGNNDPGNLYSAGIGYSGALGRGTRGVQENTFGLITIFIALEGVNSFTARALTDTVKV